MRAFLKTQCGCFQVIDIPRHMVEYGTRWRMPLIPEMTWQAVYADISLMTQTMIKVREFEFTGEWKHQAPVFREVE